MPEHEVCIGCKWNNYPICKGTIMDNGLEMSIEYLRPTFSCGQKDLNKITDFSIKKKSEFEYLQAENLHLKNEVDKLKLDLIYLINEIEKIKK